MGFTTSALTSRYGQAGGQDVLLGLSLAEQMLDAGARTELVPPAGLQPATSHAVRTAGRSFSELRVLDDLTCPSVDPGGLPGPPICRHALRKAETAQSRPTAPFARWRQGAFHPNGGH